MENFKVKLTQEEFDRFECNYPSNVVIVEMEAEKDLLASGIKINFNPDVLYAEGDGSHVADCSAVHGTIVKQVDRLYYKRKDVINSMSWKTELETQIGDVVFFHPLISKNCSEVVVGETVYKVIPYYDLFVAKREYWVDKWKGTKETAIIPLNGNVILKEVYKPKLSKFDISEPQVDKFKGIVAFNGSDNQEYQAKGVTDFKGLKYGDFVFIERNSYPFYLERSRWNSHFDQGNQYLVSQKRHIIAVL